MMAWRRIMKNLSGHLCFIYTVITSLVSLKIHILWAICEEKEEEGKNCLRSITIYITCQDLEISEG